jgi:hypothetical protein
MKDMAGRQDLHKGIAGLGQPHAFLPADQPELSDRRHDQRPAWIRETGNRYLELETRPKIHGQIQGQNLEAAAPLGQAGEIRGVALFAKLPGTRARASRSHGRHHAFMITAQLQAR